MRDAPIARVEHAAPERGRRRVADAKRCFIAIRCTVKQHSAIEHAFEGSPGTGLQPTVQLQFTSSGLEAHVRYPLALRQAMEIDERVTRAILTDFDLTHAGSPAIRLNTATKA